MARTKKDLQPIDAKIAEILSELVVESGMTRRTLAGETGMSVNRLGIILRQEPPPATVGELGLLAQALGFSASDIVERAEAAVHPAQSDYDLVAHPYTDETGELMDE
ncbi:helix-turn-helix domain-containing protein [Leucobacter salsicius]|uniref:helix-turn-helix domain-containing protein n=1 Tax=Leucobacter salsicius TaxID=664638 RepID=UPI0012F72BA0|nr:helix-turn-helix transcriptional regulator [Leucobacter salsicius]